MKQNKTKKIAQGRVKKHMIGVVADMCEGCVQEDALCMLLSCHKSVNELTDGWNGRGHSVSTKVKMT